MIPWPLLPALVWPHVGSSQVVVEAISPALQRDAEVASHIFADQVDDLVLRVHGGSGRTLSVKLELFQLAHKLAAPVSSPIAVATDLELGDRAWYDLPLSLALPEVQRITRFQARYSCKDTKATDWIAAGQSVWVVYPQSLMDPLRSLSRQRRVHVHDPRGQLKEFFRAHDILFADLDTSLPSGGVDDDPSADDSRRPLVVCVSDNSDATGSRPRDPALEKLLARVPTALILEHDEARVPRMIVSLRPGRTRVELRARLLTNLSADPESQSLLLEALERALEHSQ